MNRGYMMKMRQKRLSLFLVICSLLANMTIGYAQSTEPTATTTQVFLPVILGAVDETQLDSAVMAAAPGPFNKTYPGSGATDIPTSTSLTWNGASGARYYLYCIDTTHDLHCDWGDEHFQRVDGTSVNADLTPNTTYSWQVRAYSADGTWTPGNGSGQWWTFTTGAYPFPFKKTYPGHQATNVPTSVVLTWDPAIGAAYYLYCVDTTNDLHCDWGDNNFKRVNSTSAVETLLPGTTYSWQVRAYSSDNVRWTPGNGSGQWWTFTTTPAGSPIPYPNRSTYQIKAIQPDRWPNKDEISGNNTGGVVFNMVWDEWEANRNSPPCAAGEIIFDQHCFQLRGDYDNDLREYSRRGLVITAIVFGTPAWARNTSLCPPRSSRAERFCAPRNPADFARFVRMLARRYNGLNGNGRIADFVIQNEVNANDWYDIGCGGVLGACNKDAWIQNYATLYNAAYDAVIAEQPYAKVLISLEHHFDEKFDNLAAPSPLLSGKTFLRGFNNLVGNRAWRVAYHPYPKDLFSPSFGANDYPYVTYGNIGVLIGWLHQAFPNKPSAWVVQLTESGINSAGPNSDPQRQARAVCNSFRNVLGTPGIENYVYHRMVDYPGEGIALGLRMPYPNAAAKPAWAVWALANRNDLQPPQLSCGFELLPYTLLRRGYHASKGHRASSRLLPAGFTVENTWKLLHDPQPNTTLLFECQVGQHSLLTSAPNCENQRPLGPVGYIYNQPAAGRVALYRCYIPTNGDHFVSPAANCEGMTTERLLGYALVSGAVQAAELDAAILESTDSQDDEPTDEEQ